MTLAVGGTHSLFHTLKQLALDGLEIQLQFKMYFIQLANSEDPDGMMRSIFIGVARTPKKIRTSKCIKQ